MLFCMLFYRPAFGFAEKAIRVVFTTLPLIRASVSTERCRVHSVKSFHFFLVLSVPPLFSNVFLSFIPKQQHRLSKSL